MKARNFGYRAGFTLVELMAAIAILIVVAALVVPSAIALNEGAQERAEIRRLLNELRRARALAIAGSGVNPALPADVASTGITVISPTQYIRFFDDDNLMGGEVTLSAVDISDTNLTIQLPLPNGQVRFRRDGSRVPASANSFLLQSTSGRVFTVNVALTGLSELVP